MKIKPEKYEYMKATVGGYLDENSSRGQIGESASISDRRGPELKEPRMVTVASIRAK